MRIFSRLSFRWLNAVDVFGESVDVEKIVMMIFGVFTLIFLCFLLYSIRKNRE